VQVKGGLGEGVLLYWYLGGGIGFPRTRGSKSETAEVIVGIHQTWIGCLRIISPQQIPTISLPYGGLPELLAPVSVSRVQRHPCRLIYLLGRGLTEISPVSLHPSPIKDSTKSSSPIVES